MRNYTAPKTIDVITYQCPNLRWAISVKDPQITMLYMCVVVSWNQDWGADLVSCSATYLFIDLEEYQTIFYSCPRSYEGYTNENNEF